MERSAGSRRVLGHLQGTAQVPLRKVRKCADLVTHPWVYPTSHQNATGIGSSALPLTPEGEKQLEDGWTASV